MSIAITYDDLLRAALLLNTKAGHPKLVEIVRSYGVNRISEVKQEDRLSCLLKIIETKQARAYSSFMLMR